MKYALLTAFMGLLFFVLGPAQAQMDHVPGELLVQFKAGTNPHKVIERLATLRGTETSISLSTFLSPPMNIYLIKFNHLAVSSDALLAAVKTDRDVSIAQFNHYVYPRSTVPNDPNFNQQWHHLNTGQTNGTIDADIDTDLAWDITTGGLTALGDTIVVCVIEGGNLNHPDLRDNAWKNYGEVPGDGIDNDGNGYVDDFLGWNVASNNDAGVLTGNHGTQVMGMIGAKGNNELGVTGANWNLKIMSVAGENLFNEASVVAAYTYPLVMRKLYDQTQGERGAFVVATNASWGIDNGDVNSVPIWTAYYDTLGKYGILNCGATANNNVNIDIVGDIPTAAPSDYMISVTATNHNDIRTFSAFGPTTVDLGAPGASVVSTNGQQGYTSTSGTSFASPLTAGVIALLYSAPCESLAQLARDNPQAAADYVRFALLNGVDPVPNLQGMTVTGGRLNAFNSLMILLQNCGEGICLPPFSFNNAVSNDTLYQFTWTQVGSDPVNIRYRLQGTEEWTVLDSLAGGTMNLSGLELCSTYEFQIGAICTIEDQEGNAEVIITYGLTKIVTTSGCCDAPEAIAFNEISEETSTVSWEPVFNVEAYDVYIRPTGTTEWTFVGQYSANEATLYNLVPCAFYDVLVHAACAENFDGAAIETIRTKGCGACMDESYCENLGESSFWEFIASVSINGLVFQTGNNGGYALFENTNITLEQEGIYPMTVSPGFLFGSYNEFIRVWIDFNQDGVFSSSEVVLSSTQGSPQPLTGAINIPADALLGSTRMRVSMKFVGNSTAQVASCEVFAEGETEDYCITITESTLSTQSVASSRGASLFPNPTTGIVSLVLPEGTSAKTVLIDVTDINGRLVLQATAAQRGNLLDLSGLEQGVYLYTLRGAQLNNLLGNGKLVLVK